MREFKVNEYITLKLQNDETIIYIAGEKFRKCKYLLLSIPIEEEDLYDEIESIDKAAEKLARSIKGDGIKFEIAPEVEFWGHCSNLQAWAEHNYDTRLLHRNLSFPILKRLTELGDPLAKKFFKEEVAKRIESGHLTVIQFLINQGYLKIFNSEEIETIFYLLNYDKIFERSTFENFLTIVKQFRQIVDENEPYKLLKDKIIETYKSKTVESLLKEDIHILLNFFEKNIWKIFYDDELNKIFEQLNYSKLILDDPLKTFLFLCNVQDKSYFNANKIISENISKFKPVIFDLIRYGNEIDISDLLHYGYIRHFDSNDIIKSFNLILQRFPHNKKWFKDILGYLVIFFRSPNYPPISTNKLSEDTRREFPDKLFREHKSKFLTLELEQKILIFEDLVRLKSETAVKFLEEVILRNYSKSQRKFYRDNSKKLYKELIKNKKFEEIFEKIDYAQFDNDTLKTLMKIGDNKAKDALDKETRYE